MSLQMATPQHFSALAGTCRDFLSLQPCSLPFAFLFSLEVLLTLSVITLTITTWCYSKPVNVEFENGLPVQLGHGYWMLWRIRWSSTCASGDMELFFPPSGVMVFEGGLEEKNCFQLATFPTKITTWVEKGGKNNTFPSCSWYLFELMRYFLCIFPP